jgi:hypothetical protein
MTNRSPGPHSCLVRLPTAGTRCAAGSAVLSGWQTGAWRAAAARGAARFQQGFRSDRHDCRGGSGLLSPEALEQNARLLEGVLEDFGVKGEIIHVRPGPVVTLYELEPAPGIKSSRVIGLAEDIARSMSAIAARVAVVPGRNAIGIELPNPKRETVFCAN